MLPLTMTVGFIGYNLERYIRSPPEANQNSKSTIEVREERQLRSVMNDDGDNS